MPHSAPNSLLSETLQSSRRPWRLSVSRWWALGLLALVVAAFVGQWQYSRWQRESIADFPRECHELSTRQKWQELAGLSERWSEIEPTKADPWLYRAGAAEGLEDWSNLVRYLERVPRYDRRAVGALVRKAVAEFEQLNRPWDGLRTCEEVLELEPRVLIAHKQAIFFDAMTLQRAEMVRRIRRAIQVRREGPESYVYLVGASWFYSGSLYRHNTRWLEAAPDDEIFQVAQAMQVYTSQAKSDLERAADFEHIPPAEELLQKYPHNLELVAYFLNRSITDGDLERVQSLLETVPRERADADARFWRARSWCEDARGDLISAERSLRRAFAIDPYWWQIHFQLHDVLRRLGRSDESARFLEVYKVSKELSTAIMTMNRSEEGFDDPEFSRSLLTLAEMVHDDDVAAALRQRTSPR